MKHHRKKPYHCDETRMSALGNHIGNQSPHVQNIVSLKSSLVAKILTVLVRTPGTISNSQVFRLKIVSSFSHFFQQNISVYGIFNDQSFRDTFTNDIVSFGQCAQS